MGAVSRGPALPTALVAAVVGLSAACGSAPSPPAPPPASAPAPSSAPPPRTSASASPPVASSSAPSLASSAASVAPPPPCPKPEGPPPAVATGASLGPKKLPVVDDVPRCQAREVEMVRWANGRFAFAVDLPRHLIPLAELGQTGDGIAFVVEPDFDLRAFGMHNHFLGGGDSEEKTREMAVEEAKRPFDGDEILSVTREGPAIVRIAHKAGVRTMSKQIFEDRLIVTVSIQYPERHAAYFLPIEEHLRASLRTTTGGMYGRPAKPPAKWTGK